MAEQVVLDLVAKIDKLERELAKIPGITEREAKKMVRGFDKELKKTTRAAQRAARANADAWKKTGETAEGVKRIFDAAGGSAAGYAGTVEHLTRSALNLNSALGAAGVAAVGTVAAIGAVAAGAAAAALKTSTWVKELKEAGKTVPISDKQLAKVTAMDKSIEELTDNLKRLGIEIGSTVAPVVNEFVSTLDVALSHVRAIDDMMGNAPGWLQWLADAAGYVTGISSSPMWALLTSDGPEAPAAAVIGEIGGGAMLRAGRREEPGSASGGGRASSIDRAAAATAELAAMYLAAADTQVSAEQAIIDAHDRRIAKIGELVNEGGSLFEAEAARAASLAQMHSEMQELEAQREAERIASIERIQAAEAARWDAEQRAMAEAAEQARQYSRMQQDTAFSTASSIIDAVQMVADSRISADQQATESQRKAAKRAFAISKVMAVAQTIVNTAAGITRAFQDVPYPLSIAAAASVAATGAAQTAVVLSQQPNFANGGVMDADHRPAMLQPGEGVLTRAGVNNAGGADGIAALNQGRQMGEPQPAYVVFDHRWYDRGARQNIQRGGAIGQAISRRTRPVGHKEYSR